MPRFCHNCGNPLTDTAKFCGSCGTPVAQAPLQPEPISEPEIVKESVAPTMVFTLDSLEVPETIPEPVAAKPPVIFSLDALDVEETPVEKAPIEEAPVEEAPVEEVPAEEAPVEEAPAEEAPAEEAPAVPEVIPAPAEAPKKEKKEKKPKKEKKAKKQKPERGAKVRKGYPQRSAGRTILAVLVCILLFVWSFASLTLFNARLATTGDQGAKSLTTVVTSLDLTQIKANTLVHNLQDPNASMADWIAGKIMENYQGRVDMDPEDFKVFWRKSCFPSFLSNHLTECLKDIYSGTNTAKITAADIEQMLRTDLALIDEVFDEQLTDADIAMIAEAAIKSGIPEQVTAKGFQSNAGMLFTAVQIGLSWWVIGAAGVILLLLILLLGKVNRSVLRTFGDAGVTLMVMSGIWCVGGLVILLMPDLWNAAFYAIRPVGAAIAALMGAGLIPSAIVFGAGAFLLLIKTIGKAIVIKSAKKADLKRNNNTEVTL